MLIEKRTSTHNNVMYPGRKIEYIVIHYTAGVRCDNNAALNVISWYLTEGSNVSSDYVVDESGAVQYNPDIKNRYTWHCGGSKYNTQGGSLYGKCTNANSIGVEICCYNDTGYTTRANSGNYHFTAVTLRNAVDLVTYLMNRYKIPADHVVRHYDVTGKLCPGVIGWNEDSGDVSQWERFKQLIGDIPKPKPIQYKVYASKIVDSYEEALDEESELAALGYKTEITAL